MRFFVFASALLALAQFSPHAQAANACPANLIPMYEGVIKNEAMLKSDEKLIQEVVKQEHSRTKGAAIVAASGWRYFIQQRDPLTAMKRFNQAWLLDPENGEAYYGMAVMSEVLRDSGQFPDCPYSPALSDRLFKIAFTKPGTSPTAKVDYGRFLWTQDRLDESITVLREVTTTAPQARNARSNLAFVYYRKGDFVQACDWAKEARKVGDILEPGFLEDMCARAQ